MGIGVPSEHHRNDDAGPRELRADLSDYYPTSSVQPSVNGDGGAASPATASSKASVNGGAPLHHSPALTVIVLVVVSLVLLHRA